jgi:hypothetical protein
MTEPRRLILPQPVRRLAGRLPFQAPDGLSSRLLLLTAVFTVAVGGLIIVPSASSFQERWLRDRIQSAELASVGVEALPYNAVSDEVAEQLLRIGGVSAVAVSEEGVLSQLLQAPSLPRTPDFIDLRNRPLALRLTDPWRTLTGYPDRSSPAIVRATISRCWPRPSR